MGRSGGDGQRGSNPAPGGEPEPAELWIDGASAGTPAGDPAAGGTGASSSGPPPGPGGTPRARWIALAAGFVVLVAVIAVQHFAGGRPAASPAGTPSSTPDSTASSQAGTPDSTESSSPPLTPSSSGTDLSGLSLESAQARLSGEGVVTGSGEARATLSTPPLGTAGTRQTTGSPTSTSPTSTVDTTSPTTSTVAKRPGAGDWELIGYGSDGVVRYRPTSGRLVVTPVPRLQDDYLLSFVATRSAAVVRAMNDVVGYLVPDGKPAESLDGLLQQAVKALPGPDPQHLWVVRQSYTVGVQDGSTDNAEPGQIAMPSVTLDLVDVHGKPVGTTIRLPAEMYASNAYGTGPDGAGYALVYGVGGTYDVRPDAIHLVTHGQLAAVGPTAFLAYECDDTAHCGMVAIDRATWQHHPLPDLSVQAGILSGSGAISPDGSTVAVLNVGQSGVTVDLVDMDSGKSRHTNIAINDNDIVQYPGLVTFTPDGSTLLVAGLDGVYPVDVRTGKVGSPLPVPAVSTIAVRPAG